jgi:AcrR family transcriptional regulator
LDDESKQQAEGGWRLMVTRQVPAGLADKLTSATDQFAVAFEDIRMDDIATASGIPRATLYYYFSGKEDVLAFLLRSMLDDLRVSVAAALEVPGDTRTRLRAVMRAQFGHLAANPAASQLLIMNLGRAGRVDTLAAGIDDGFHTPVRQILVDGVAAGHLVDIDVDVTAAAVFGAVTIVGLRSLVSGDGLDVDAVTDRLFPVFWSGIATATKAARAKR